MSTAKRTTCALSLVALGAAAAFAVVIWPRVLAAWNVGRLEHRYRAVRESAAETLGRLGRIETVPPLCEAVAAKRISPEAAARSFVLFGRPILPALFDAVSDPRRALRQAALEGILGIEPDEHAPEAKLLRDLSTSDQDQQAIPALSRLDPPSTVAVLALAGMARDSKYAYVHLAADALGRIGPAGAAAVPALLAVVADGAERQRGNVAEALTEIAPEDERVVEALVRAHEDDVAAGRRDFAHELLVDAIGKLGPAARAAVPSLVRDLENGQGAVRGKAARALGAIGPDATRGHEAMAALAAALRSGHEGLVSDAGDALIAFGAAAVPLLAETAALAFEHRARSAAVRALGIIGSRAHEAVPVLLELLDDPGLKLDAVEALGGIGPRASGAVPALVRLYRAEDDPNLTWRLSEALTRIGPPAIEGLMAMLAERDGKLRLRALRTIAAIGNAVLMVERPIRSRLDDLEPEAALDMEVSTSLFDAAPIAYDERIGLGDWFQRRELVDVIVRLGDPPGKVGPVLRSALDSEDLVVRLRACRALWRRGEVCDRRLVSIAGRLFRERVAFIHLGRGPWYVPEDRHEAAQVLAEMGPRGRDALPALERAIRDPEPGFRAFAALALWKVAGDGRLADVAKALLGAAAERREPTCLLQGAAGSARPAVRHALGEVGPAALPHILPRLDDPDEQVRMALVEGVGRIRPVTVAARDALTARLADEDHRVRVLAREALGRLAE